MVKIVNGRIENACPKLRWRGVEYILVNGDGNKTEGAIATEEEYEQFALNQFHLMEDGSIMSFGEVVGNVSEIEWLD